MRLNSRIFPNGRAGDFLRLRRALWFLLIGLCLTGPAHAEIRRYGVLIGNARGLPDETELLYTMADVRKLESILLAVGQFQPTDLVILANQSESSVSDALLQVNRRIAAQMQGPEDQALLLVYYSGHADQNALHLGAGRLPLTRLRELVKKCPATVRILILDACRSGAMTQVKGFKKGPAFPVQIHDRLSGEGLIVITSSAVNEDSHESDFLKGSFFTHHLSSGLLGAADVSGDGRVSLAEAYRYAYERTIASTSRTLSGIQHPTYHFDLRGKDDLILTDLQAHSGQRARLWLPAGGNYLFMRGRDGGGLVAEALAEQPRLVTLPAGRYFVRHRAADHLREGVVTMRPGSEQKLDLHSLTRVPYEQMVRKGLGERRLAHGPVAIFVARAPIVAGLSWQPMGGIGYAWHLPWFSVSSRLLAGGSSGENLYLELSQREVLAEVFCYRSFDWTWLTASVGIDLGLSYLHQSFQTTGMAPDNDSLAFLAGIQAELVAHLAGRISLHLEAAGLVYFFPEQRASGETQNASPFVPRLGLGLGYQF